MRVLNVADFPKISPFGFRPAPRRSFPHPGTSLFVLESNGICHGFTEVKPVLRSTSVPTRKVLDDHRRNRKNHDCPRTGKPALRPQPKSTFCAATNRRPSHLAD